MNNFNSVDIGEVRLAARTLVAVTVTLLAVQRQERAPGQPPFMDPTEAQQSCQIGWARTSNWTIWCFLES